MVASRPIIGSVHLAATPSAVRKIAKKRGCGFWKIMFILLALTSILVLLFLLTPFLRRDLHNSCSSYNSLNKVNYDWIEKNWINGPPPTWSIFVYLFTCISHLFCLIKQILLCYDTLHGFRLDYNSFLGVINNFHDSVVEYSLSLSHLSIFWPKIVNLSQKGHAPVPWGQTMVSLTSDCLLWQGINHLPSAIIKKKIF